VTTTAEARQVSWQPSAGAILRARELRDARDAAIGGHRPRFAEADEINDTRWTGEILEWLFAGDAARRGVECRYLGGKGEPDFDVGGVTIDCKAGSGRGQPRSEYRVEVSCDERSSPVHFHVFGHWTPEERRMYLVGAASHRRLLEVGVHYDCGDRLPGGFRVKDRRGILSLTMGELGTLDELFAFLSTREEARR
jgi:hypothetical protein